MNDAHKQEWNGRALNELLSVVSRNAARMARHLQAQGLLHDPRHILCALAARRLLPLEAPVMRPLARSSESVEAQAFHQLQAPDRRVLWPGHASSATVPADVPAEVPAEVPAPGTREHLASALLRLTWKTQAARRSSPNGAPPA